MNMFKNLYKVCAAALLALGVFGCQEQEMVKPYALLAESSLTFEAKDAEAQVLTIATDEGWIVDVDSDWITIDPTSGSQTTYANVTVTDNVDANGKLAAPRQGKITIAATRGEYSIETVIYQKGDTYLEAQEYTVTNLTALENTEELAQIPAKVKEATVVAVAEEGFVISDGTSNILVSGAREVAVGNKVTLNGHKVTANNLPVFLVDEVLTNNKATEATYPTATDISATLDSYTATKSEYISVEGTLVDNTVTNIAGASKSLTVYKNAELAKVNIHKVVVSGYFAGIVNGSPVMVVANIKDNGEDLEFGAAFPYNDDFSWVDPFVEKANTALPDANKINDSVGEVTSSSDGAANIYTTLANNGLMILDELRARGYKDLNPGQKTIYLQQGYFKYGKGACQSGLTFPFLKIEGTQDIVVSFRWCAHMAGDGGIDGTKLVVGITGPGSMDGETASTKVPGQKVSKAISHNQQDNQMFWNDASVKITGATRATNITIRPCDEQFGSVEDPKSGYFRYYIDDISVVNAADAVESTITVSGVENNLITFEGTPEGPAKFEVSADKDYKILTSAKWFSVSETEGLGGETKTVEVTCEPSELSTLRQGTITIKSGTSTYTISIVQSAAGQELDPYIALSTGNNVTVLGEGEEFSAKVQTNTTYEIETSDWIEVVTVPATKAKTEWFEHKFTAKVNLTGAERTGFVRFINKDKNIESVLNVHQENFVPRVDVTPGCKISGVGALVPYSIDANIPFAVSTSDSWITLPANQGPAGKLTVPIAFAANDQSVERTGTITLKNPEYNYEKTLQVVQFPSGIYFQDDFSWVAPWADKYGSADSVADDNASGKAPNVYTHATHLEGGVEGYPAFLTWFNALGYEDINPSTKSFYTQKYYLKFGKTDAHVGIKLPPIYPVSAADVELSFNWCAHMTGGGNIDKVKIVVEIEGDGVCADSNAKISNEFTTTQVKKDLAWQDASVTLKGITGNSRIIVRPSVMDNSDGVDQKRWYIDNIVIK